MQNNKSNLTKVKKQKKFSEKKISKDDIVSQRRKGFKLELVNNTDSNTWDELCTSLIPSWCRENRGIIVARKSSLTNEWDIKTSLHPQTSKYVFEKIQEYYEETDLSKELMIELWGKKFYLIENTTDIRKNKVFWLSDKISDNELGLILFKDLCVIFFYEKDNKGTIDDKVIIRFVKLLKKLTRRI